MCIQVHEFVCSPSHPQGSYHAFDQLLGCHKTSPSAYALKFSTFWAFLIIINSATTVLVQACSLSSTSSFHLCGHVHIPRCGSSCKGDCDGAKKVAN